MTKPGVAVRGGACHFEVEWGEFLLATADAIARYLVDHAELLAIMPHTKGDRSHKRTTFNAPALARLCPVEAYTDWIALAGLTEGAVFRRIDRWGHIGGPRFAH